MTCSSETEHDRQRRVLDQLTTMHALLRDRFLRRSTALTLSTLALAALAVSLAFASHATDLTLFGIDAKRATWIGWLSVLVLILTIADLKVDWAARSRAHRDAVIRLTDLKNRFRRARYVDSEATQDAVELALEYARVIDGLPAIPDRLFLKLKSAHIRKVEVSKMIDQMPGRNWRLLRFDLWRSSQRLDATSES